GPSARAFDRAQPPRVKALALVGRHARLEPRGDGPPPPQLVGRLPHTGRETREERRTEGRRLLDRRDFDGNSGDVRLELHQKTVRRPTAVDAKHLDRLTRAAHRLDEIPRLVRDALERGTSDVRARRAALDPDQQTARVHIPVWRAEARERG